MNLLGSPFDYWKLGFSSLQMFAEAQTVIALRLMGMQGFWPVATSETARMVEEKLPAFIRSGSAATEAAIRGKRPDQIAQAALRPIRARTRANAKRLTRAPRR